MAMRNELQEMRNELQELSLSDTRKKRPAYDDGPSARFGGRQKISDESFEKMFVEAVMRQLAEKPKPDYAKIAEFNKRLQREQAVEALKHYHKIEGVDYELSEIVSASNTVFRRSYGFHLNFEAIPKDGIDRRPKLFFAELFKFFGGPNSGTYWVSLCMILVPSSPDVVKGCRDCTEKVLHPKREKFFSCPPELLQDKRNSSEHSGGSGVAGGICPTCKRWL